MSNLEYGSVTPYYNCQKIIIEKVQRRFLKFLSFKMDGFYPVRNIVYILLTNRFNIDSPALRRKCSEISFLYKLLHNQIDSIELLSQIYFRVPFLNTRKSQTFYCVRGNTNLCLKSPLYHMCSTFNLKCDINYDNLNYVL